ncbi:hypothetical protein NE237_029164 [Protea cynaroides]|uniref:Uncharacterized protein n=1 Tax=Protea cynaroides TaxID=273540 RepID=A0A9Q0GUR3_9MAGN|nr:hypothetical protein NE237_029164 [Protea cynaroides]
MDVVFLFSGGFPYVWFFIAAAITSFCCLCALWAVRLSPLSILWRVKRKNFCWGSRTESSLKKAACGCSCSCGVSVEGSDFIPAPYANGSARDMHERAPVVAKRAEGAERQSGASLMELLVPEIPTHVLSYLDIIRASAVFR